MHRRALEGVLAIVVGALIACAVTLYGCKSWLAPAIKTTWAVKASAELFDQGLATAARAKHRKCIKEYPSKSTAYGQCMAKHWKALQAWRKYGARAVATALTATIAAIRVAKAHPGDKKLTLAAIWALVAPPVCALARIVDQWLELLPRAIASQIKYWLALAKGVSCG